MPLYQPIIATALTTVTGGGTVALGGFTLTVPATGTAALLATANNFTATQTIYNSGSALGISLAGAAAGGTVAIAATSPAQAASATAGTPLSITASVAVAGSSNAGAAAGGSITLTAGNAARLTSGNAAGGDIILAGGASIGGGRVGVIWLPASGQPNNQGFYSTSNGTISIALASDTSYNIQINQNRGIVLPATGPFAFGWNGNSTASGSAAADTALARNAAGAVEINNGTAGQWGKLLLGVRDTNTGSIIDVLTLGHQISSGTPGASMGAAILFNLNTTTTADQNAARVAGAWNDATHATRSGDLIFGSYYTTTLNEGMRIRGASGGAQISWFGGTPVSKQTSGANLTNNVTSGGTDDTIADFTDLTIYANDAATIRNDIYQLARKLKQLNDGLRSYVLFT